MALRSERTNREVRELEFPRQRLLKCSRAPRLNPFMTAKRLNDARQDIVVASNWNDEISNAPTSTVCLFFDFTTMFACSQLIFQVY